MDQFIFITSIGIMAGLSILWGYKVLPREHWQIMAVVPRRKNSQKNSQKSGHGNWQGLNLTYYGLLSANAYTFAVVLFFILAASVQIPVSGLCVVIFCILGICIPASRLVAQVVEKKTGTLTVGGAVFVGTLAAPWLVFLVNAVMGRAMGFHISPIVLLAALSVSYAFGEGLGRLACISFGCCYGKPLSRCHPMVQKLFSRFYLIFWGHTKKISYASGLEGEKVVPVQIITAVLYSVSGLGGLWLYLNGYFEAALLSTLAVTQIWRFGSEFLRDDFRGGFSITPYQIMALATLVYAGCAAVVIQDNHPVVLLSAGVSALWNPWMIIFIQLVWVASFLHTGRSSVTGSSITFHVEETQI